MHSTRIADCVEQCYIFAAHTRIKPFSRPYLGGKRGAGSFPDTPVRSICIPCTVILDTYSAGSVGMYGWRIAITVAESMEGGRGQRIKIGVSIIAYSNAWYQDTGIMVFSRLCGIEPACIRPPDNVQKSCLPETMRGNNCNILALER